MIELENYKSYIKDCRKEYFINDTPYDVVYREFKNLDLVDINSEYFYENASTIIETIRANIWEKYQIKEREFTSKMLSALYSTDDIANLSNIESVSWFINNFPEHIYALNLSNTQSRRSRSGKEFESIIELILIGANIPMDSQIAIGKKSFIEKGLTKIVDIVSPSCIHYALNKRNTVLISAKTTLRERWQEVPEELNRTAAREIFLATLDENITSEVISTLNDNNIQLVTTRRLKKEKYASYTSVLDFETLLIILKQTNLQWDNYPYTKADKAEITMNLQRNIQNQKLRPFVANYYKQYLEILSKP